MHHGKDLSSLAKEYYPSLSNHNMKVPFGRKSDGIWSSRFSSPVRFDDLAKSHETDDLSQKAPDASRIMSGNLVPSIHRGWEVR